MSRCASLLAVALALAAAPGCAESDDAGRPLAIERVSVLPMDAARVLADHTVLVRRGRITALGPAAEVAVPWHARRLDGRGGFLLPGLADMHVHLTAEAELGRALDAGITLVRNMRGTPRHLDWRARIERGELVGPRLRTAGPYVDGDPPFHSGSAVVRDAEAARAEVRRQRAAGYDFIKVYGGLSPDAFAGLVAGAHEAGLPLVGHVPDAVGLEAVVAAGLRSIEHAEELTHSFVWSGPGRLRALAARMRERELWLCPTLHEHAAFAPAAVHRTRLELIGALHAAGVPLLAGTDAEPAALVHELRQLVAAGLSPYQALRAATIEPARALGLASELGTVEPGKRADLVLLDADPLRDVGAIARVRGVVVRGRWRPAPAPAD
ncbi:MAG: amidohydrolase family protein [Myxococcota bacterium]|nr:amidohydrolase family protein [Myxococcota bacterium]